MALESNASSTTIVSSTSSQSGLSSASNTTVGSSDTYVNVSINQIESFPWYTSEETFYTRTYSETTFLPFREYYLTTGTPIVSGIISNPVVFDISERTPAIVYYGAGTALPYSQYVSTMPSNTNDLWIQGTTNWTQYAVVPVGTWLQLVANAPAGGAAGFYEVVQTETQNVDYSVYQLNSGYSTMSFQADVVGRHMLYFVVNNQPSNLVVVDVFEAASV